MHGHTDTTFSRLEVALRARHDRLVRRLGARPTTTLGTGSAVFGGGITSVSPTGDLCALRSAPAIWVWPATIGGSWALLVLVLVVAVDGPVWLLGALIGFFTVVFGGALLAALLFFAHRRRQRLVIDARSRTLDLVDGDRHDLRLPAGFVRSVRVQRYENGDGESVWNVLVHVGFAELWIHQDHAEHEGRDLARRVGASLGVPVETFVEEVV